MPLMRKHFITDCCALCVQPVDVLGASRASQEDPLTIPKLLGRWIPCRIRDGIHDALELFQCSPVRKTRLIIGAPARYIAHEHIHSHKGRWMITVLDSIRIKCPRAQDIEHTSKRQKKITHCEFRLRNRRVKVGMKCLSGASKQILKQHMRDVAVRIYFHSLNPHCVFDVIAEAWFLGVGHLQSRNGAGCLETVTMNYVAQFVGADYLHVGSEKRARNSTDIGIAQFVCPQDRSNLRRDCQTPRKISNCFDRWFSDCDAGKIIDIERHSVSFARLDVVEMEASHAIRRSEVLKVVAISPIHLKPKRVDCIIENRIAKSQVLKSARISLAKVRIIVCREIATKSHFSVEEFIRFVH